MIGNANRFAMNGTIISFVTLIVAFALMMLVYVLIKRAKYEGVGVKIIFSILGILLVAMSLVLVIVSVVTFSATIKYIIFALS